jgi:hypothetical protein
MTKMSFPIHVSIIIAFYASGAMDFENPSGPRGAPARWLITLLSCGLWAAVVIFIPWQWGPILGLWSAVFGCAAILSLLCVSIFLRSH